MPYAVSAIGSTESAAAATVRVSGEKRALTGLRGRAACLVMLYHFTSGKIGGPIVQHGYMAVDLFFVLSGYEELRSVSFRFYQGDFSAYEEAAKTGRLAGAGYSDNLLGHIEWEGVGLDSIVKVTYGEWVRSMFESRSLASINGEAYFRLRSDYAKAFWPYIDSQPDYSWVSVDTLAELAGRNYTTETTRQKLKFREECRQAFSDMTAAGGLASWSCDETGSGRRKSYRYNYVHNLPKIEAAFASVSLARQGRLKLGLPADDPT